MFFTEKINRILSDWRNFTKTGRLQYTTDSKALMCRSDLLEKERNTLQTSLKIEEGMFYVSRVYVPYSIFKLYRRGAFDDSFSLLEIKHMIRILIVMHLLDLSGHALLRYMTNEVVGKYVDLNANEFAYKKRQNLDDYLSQKNYFKDKKK